MELELHLGFGRGITTSTFTSMDARLCFTNPAGRGGGGASTSPCGGRACDALRVDGDELGAHGLYLLAGGIAHIIRKDLARSAAEESKHGSGVLFGTALSTQRLREVDFQQAMATRALPATSRI